MPWLLPLLTLLHSQAAKKFALASFTTVYCFFFLSFTSVALCVGTLNQHDKRAIQAKGKNMCNAGSPRLAGDHKYRTLALHCISTSFHLLPNTKEYCRCIPTNALYLCSTCMYYRQKSHVMQVDIWEHLHIQSSMLSKNLLQNGFQLSWAALEGAKETGSGRITLSWFWSPKK